MKILHPVRFALLAAALAGPATIPVTPEVPVAAVVAPADQDQGRWWPSAADAVPTAVPAMAPLALADEPAWRLREPDSGQWQIVSRWWTPWLLTSFGLCTLVLILAVSFWTPPGPSILGAVGLAVRTWLAHALGVHGVPAEAWRLPTPKRLLVLIIVAGWVFAGLVVAHVAVQAAAQPF